MPRNTSPELIIRAVATMIRDVTFFLNRTATSHPKFMPKVPMPNSWTTGLTRKLTPSRSTGDGPPNWQIETPEREVIPKQAPFQK
jgi:hypothetical protein